MGLLQLLNLGDRTRVLADIRETRHLKARRIALLLKAEKNLTGARLLDFGAGNGIIARALCDDVGANGEVVAADIVARHYDEPVHFVQVIDGVVPEPEASFDVIVSNHVLEHVGPPSAQLAYLAECRRLLKPNGVMFLALPNRFSPIETHYRLPLVSWWPASWRSDYLKVLGHLGARPASKSMTMDRYPLWPHTRRVLVRLVSDAGFAARDITRESARQSIEIETDGLVRDVLRVLLPVAFPIARSILPTYIFLCRHRMAEPDQHADANAQ